MTRGRGEDGRLYYFRAGFNLVAMEIEIRHNLKLRLYGFSGAVKDFQFGPTGIALSERMWKVVAGHQLENDGINIWVYDSMQHMFTGVRLATPPDPNLGLEERVVTLDTYAWYKHVGPYTALFAVNQQMREELSRRKISYGVPSLEIYGHHSPDESKLETEIVYSVRS